MTPTDELTKRLSRVLMDHAVQFLDLIDATLLLVVEDKDGKRYWLSNGPLRDEFRVKGLDCRGSRIEELTPVPVTTRTEIYSTDDDEGERAAPSNFIPPPPIVKPADKAAISEKAVGAAAETVAKTAEKAAAATTTAAKSTSPKSSATAEKAAAATANASAAKSTSPKSSATTEKAAAAKNAAAAAATGNNAVAAAAVATTEDDASNDDELDEFAEENLICFSPKELSDLLMERRKILASYNKKKENRTKTVSCREVLREENEIKRAKKSVEMVKAVIDAKKAKEKATATGKNAQDSNNKRKIPPTSESSATPVGSEEPKKPKIIRVTTDNTPASATTAKSAAKSSETSKSSKAATSSSSPASSGTTTPMTKLRSSGFTSAAGNAVKCNKCGLAGHIALDCKNEKADEKEEGAAEAAAASSENEDVKPELDASGNAVAASANSEKTNGATSAVETTKKKSSTPTSKTASSTPADSKKKSSDFVCHYCNAPGHVKSFCFKMKQDLANGVTNGGFHSQKPGLLGRADGPPNGPGNFMPPNGPPMRPSQSIMGAPPPPMGMPPPPMNGPPPGFGPPMTGPPPFNNGGFPPENNMDERAIVEMRLDGLRSSHGIRFSWSPAECAFLVMMHDRQLQNDQIVRIHSLEQFMHVFGN